MKFAQLERVIETAGEPPVPVPVASPVTVEEWIQQGRINPQTATTQPELLQRQLNAATSRCQDWCRRSFCTQKLLARYIADGKGCSCAGMIVLPRGTVQSVESVMGSGGIVIDPTDYALVGNVLTLTTPPTSGAVSVTWISGYGDAAAVPDGIKEAIYEYATVLYENRLGERERGSVIEFMPSGIEDLLREFQIEIEG